MQKFEAIGKYIYRFSHLEGVLRVVAQNLLKLSTEQFHGLMPVIDFAALCSICKAQILKSDPERVIKGVALINRAHKCNEDRIRIAHGHWFSIDDGFGAFHSSRSTLKSSLYFSEAGELEQKADEVADLSEEIWDFFLAPKHGPIA